MYATWLDYNKITNMGAKKEVLTIGSGAWDMRFMTTSSPSVGSLNRIITLYVGLDVENRGAQELSGARPALYHLRIIINGLL